MGIARTLRQWWSDRQEADAYLTLNPQERASLARDVGVSSQMLASLVSREQQASRELPQVLHAVGLDPATVKHQHPDLVRDMIVACSICQAKHECHHDLNGDTAARRFQQYCPNAREISALEAERWERREKLIQNAGSGHRRHNRAVP